MRWKTLQLGNVNMETKEIYETNKWQNHLSSKWQNKQNKPIAYNCVNTVKTCGSALFLRLPVTFLNKHVLDVSYVFFSFPFIVFLFQCFLEVNHENVTILTQRNLCSLSYVIVIVFYLSKIFIHHTYFYIELKM